MPAILFHAINPDTKVPYDLWSGVYFLKHVELVKLLTGEKNSKDGLAQWEKLTQAQRDGVLRHSLGYRYPSTSVEYKMDLTFHGALELSACLSGPNAAVHASCIRSMMQKYKLGVLSLGQPEPEPGSAMDKPVATARPVGAIQQCFARVCDGASRADPPVVVSAESPSSLDFIPLDELHPGSKARQGLIGPDRAQFLSTRDVIMGLYGKAWGDAKAEKAASARWNNISDEDKEKLGDDLKTCKFPDYVKGAPAVAFHALPEFCKMVLREKAGARMPAVVELMQKYFVGDQALIPVVQDGVMAENQIPFDCFTAGASGRLVVLGDVQHLAIPDILKGMSGDAAGAWRDLTGDKKEELRPHMKKYQFSGTCFTRSSK